jgi:uncharacterized membrane protein AbrB (regulator of aidB expression)
MMGKRKGVTLPGDQRDPAHDVDMTSTLSGSEIFVGLALTVGLAVGCQVVASKLKLPAIILLLPVGFVAGWLRSSSAPRSRRS